MSGIRYLIAMALLAGLTAAALVGVDRFGRGCRVYGFAGDITAPGVSRVEVPGGSQAYQVWKKAGFRGRTVVYLTDKWESFTPHEIEAPPMSRPYPLELFNLARENERSKLDDVSFIYVAYLNGIVRRMITVLPQPGYQEMLARARGSKNYTLSGDRFSFPFEGFPRSFSLDPGAGAGQEPVLLVIGASFFRYSEPEAVLASLKQARVRSDCVILCQERGKVAPASPESGKLARFAGLIGTGPGAAGASQAPTAGLPEHSR